MADAVPLKIDRAPHVLAVDPSVSNELYTNTERDAGVVSSKVVVLPLSMFWRSKTRSWVIIDLHCEGRGGTNIPVGVSSHFFPSSTFMAAFFRPCIGGAKDLDAQGAGPELGIGKLQDVIG